MAVVFPSAKPQSLYINRPTTHHRFRLSHISQPIRLRIYEPYHAASACCLWLRRPPPLTSYIQGDNSSVHPILISYLERGGLHPCDMNKSNKWGSRRNHLDIFELPAIRKSRGNRRWYMKITIEAKIQCSRISLPEGMQ